MILLTLSLVLFCSSIYVLIRTKINIWVDPSYLDEVDSLNLGNCRSIQFRMR